MKVRLATVWFGGCSGCHMSFLDLDEFLIELAQKIEIVFSPVVDTKEYPEGVDVCLIEGAVCNEEHVEMVHKIRKRTKGSMLWLRATGSTVVSQLIDSFVVLFIAFYGPLSASQIFSIGLTNYLYKFAIAIAITPLLYLVHAGVDRYLGHELSAAMAKDAHPAPSGQQQRPGNA